MYVNNLISPLLHCSSLPKDCLWKRVDLEDFSQQARPGSAPGLGEVGAVGEVGVFVAWRILWIPLRQPADHPAHHLGPAIPLPKGPFVGDWLTEHGAREHHNAAFAKAA